MEEPPGQSENNKRISLALESTFDCSGSLFSTLDSGEISPIIELDLPHKKLKSVHSTIGSISSRSDTIVGEIHPSNMDMDNLDDSLTNPGSPVDRSTPISDYEMAETEVGTDTLNSSESPPLEAHGQAETVETSLQENTQQQNSPFTIRTKDYRVSPPPSRNFL